MKKIASLFLVVIFSLILSTTAIADVTWVTELEGEDYLVWSDGTKYKEIVQGDSAKLYTGYFSSSYSKTINLVVQVNDNTGKKISTVVDKNIDVSSLMGYEEITIKESHYKKPGIYTIVIRLDDSIEQESDISLTLNVAAPIVIDADKDDDGIKNNQDNCPDTFNPGQNDYDSDGVGDLCDGCINDKNNDLDNDGFCGDVDNCPDTFNPGQNDYDSDGVGDLCDKCTSEKGTTENKGCPEEKIKDTDGDGVVDFYDNCVEVANADQEDFDSDGVGNLCDNCFFVANADQEDKDNDYIGDLCDACPDEAGHWCSEKIKDKDDDGIADSEDNCIFVPNIDQSDLDGDGIGDACDTCANDKDNDIDYDGFCGDVDNCPNEKGFGGENGCPPVKEKDTDGDGIVDSEDNCVFVINSNQKDSDSDGIGDVCDACPDEAGTSLNNGCAVEEPKVNNPNKNVDILSVIPLGGSVFSKGETIPLIIKYSTGCGLDENFKFQIIPMDYNDVFVSQDMYGGKGPKMSTIYYAVPANIASGNHLFRVMPTGVQNIDSKIYYISITIV